MDHRKRQKTHHHDLGKPVYKWPDETPSQCYSMYTIAWICALSIEMSAALAMLDNIHQPLNTHDGDNNTYILGSIKQHNVVIVGLPAGLYGTTSATIAVANLKRTFPQIRVGLMVGIGGGVPTKADVRLGDIVVGLQGKQCDLGKVIKGGKLQRTAIPRLPHPSLLTLVTTLRSELGPGSSIGSNRVLVILQERLGGRPEYSRPNTPDRLFHAEYDHEPTATSCDKCDKSNIVQRSMRISDDPEIHYGAIASGNQVMKDARSRDLIGEELDALYFEMEAAGLMDVIPCLPIRGICDYSDSHKSDEWQGYASATAAAYGRVLLERLPSVNVPQLRMSHHEQTDQPEMREAVQECLRSLAFNSMDDRSKQIRPAAKGTCNWLWANTEFLDWACSNQRLFWIKGKPGSGKSTLMKHFLDNIENTPGFQKEDIVLSFFFHARSGGELQKTPHGLFRSLLHQLLRKVPTAMEDLVFAFEVWYNSQKQIDESYNWGLVELEKRLEQSLQKTLETNHVWLLVDALDESGKENAREMLGCFKSLLRETKSVPSKFRICFTCRPYPQLGEIGGFQICLENENDNDISTWLDQELDASNLQSFSERIRSGASGVFMWANLVVKRIRDLELSGARRSKIEEVFITIPRDLDDMYLSLVHQIRAEDSEELSDSLKLFQWICFATRPLSLAEIYWAMAIDAKTRYKSIQECQKKEGVPGDAKVERQVLELSKGLVEITDTQAVQFIHQSVMEFFLKKGLSALDNSITSTEGIIGTAHSIMSRTCINYLSMEEFGQWETYTDGDFPLTSCGKKRQQIRRWPTS